MHLQLRIDKLILPDFTAATRRRIVVALEIELARLFDEEGLPPALNTGQAQVALETSPITIPMDMLPDSIGRHVAQAIYIDLVRATP